MSHLDNMPFEESVAKQIEEHFYKGLHLTFCRKSDDTLAIVSSSMLFFNLFNINKSLISNIYAKIHVCLIIRSYFPERNGGKIPNVSSLRGNCSENSMQSSSSTLTNELREQIIEIAQLNDNLYYMLSVFIFIADHCLTKHPYFL